MVVIATERYKEMYSSCRDGYAASFEYDGTGWANNNNTGVIDIKQARHIISIRNPMIEVIWE